jgi:hypothetical protein
MCGVWASYSDLRQRLQPPPSLQASHPHFLSSLQTVPLQRQQQQQQEQEHPLHCKQTSHLKLQVQVQVQVQVQALPLQN